VDAPGVPEVLRGLLRRALSPDPEDRPKDGGAWLAELLGIQEELDRPRVEPAPPPPVSRRRASGEWPLVLIATGIAAAAIGALVWGLVLLK